MTGCLPGSGKAPANGSRSRLQRGSKTPRAGEQRGKTMVLKRFAPTRLAIVTPLRRPFYLPAEQSQQNKFSVKPHADRRHQSRKDDLQSDTGAQSQHAAETSALTVFKESQQSLVISVTPGALQWLSKGPLSILDAKSANSEISSAERKNRQEPSTTAQ